MVSSKHISKIIIVLTALTVIACLLAVVFQDKVEAMVGGSGVTMEYETKLFDTDEVMQVNISIDEDDWEDMLSNALSEEYYTCDVEINGLTVKNVAIRPKGNTSLTNIANDPDTDRYSLKLEFDHYVEGQTCYGLDKLILNNNYADATNMKEAIVYDMYQFLGADASLYNYAEVYVNGEVALPVRSGWKPTPFPLHLKKGDNEVLVVTHGGSRQHWFTFFTNMDVQ